MKRALLFILALVMAFSLVACGGGSKGKTYKGTGDNKGEKLTISGKTVTVTTKETLDEDDIGMDVKMTLSGTLTGTIVDEEDDELEVEIKKVKMSMKITGDDAKEFKEMYKSMAGELDGDEKDLFEDLIDGKTITIKPDDELWDILGVGEETIIIELDKEEGTFEADY